MGRYGAPEQGLPPVLFHGQPDGTFSASSAVAVEFPRGHCPEPPVGDFGIRRERDEHLYGAVVGHTQQRCSVSLQITSHV